MPTNPARQIAALALAMLTAPALAQQPTDEQISAIRAACRSDFMAHCAGVPRGGADALRCLKQNLAQLSPACQTAVSAIGPKSPPAAPAAAPATPPAPPPAAPATAAPATPAPAAPAAASMPPATPPAAAPAPKPIAKPTKPAHSAPPTPAAAAVAPAPPPPAQPAPLGPIPPLPPRARLAILRACAAEHQALCADVPPGGGRIVECLAANGAALSPGCRGAILSAR